MLVIRKDSQKNVPRQVKHAADVTLTETCCSVKVVLLRRCLRRAKPSSFSSGCRDSGYDVSDDASATKKSTTI